MACKIHPSKPVLKLGGSVITAKDDTRLILRRNLLQRIAQEIASVAECLRPLVLVHGAGSYGHQIVARTRIHEKMETAADRLAWAETQILQNELNAEVCRIFLDEGIPAFPYQASSSARMRNGNLDGLEGIPLRELVKQGILPVLYGVPAVEETGGCRILSGDVLAVFAAKFLGASHILHGTDVDGVFDKDPKLSTGMHEEEKQPKKWFRISRENWEQVKQGLTGSCNTDVTGGMAGKVQEALMLSRDGISARIFDATESGAVKEALQGKPLGTEIQW